MAYDEKLADRVRAVLGDHDHSLEERKMFGGVAFLVRGNMCCGIVGDDLMVRIGKDGHADALSKPHARPMNFTGRPLLGFVYVAPAGMRTARALWNWVERGVTFASSLPAKKPAPRKLKPKR